MKEFKYPIKENLKFVSEQDIGVFLEILFGNITEWTQDMWIGIRGIGEKCTPRYGNFSEDRYYSPANKDPIGRIVLESAKRYAQSHVATYIIPAILKAKRGTSENVSLFTNLLTDLDDGDTDAKLAWLTERIGEPSMVVLSGGLTESGHKKRHIYYRLTHPTPDIQKAIILRAALADKIAGDPQFGLGVEGNPFGRAHQPVRIAGTCHAKDCIAKACSIETASGRNYDFEVLEKAINEMPVSQWGVPPHEIRQSDLPRAGTVPTVVSSSMFSSTSGIDAIDAALTQPVYQGGTDRTRWTEFSRVAGYYLHLARRGDMTVDEAREMTLGWVAAKMIPPWPTARCDREFTGLLNADTKRNGAMPKPDAPLIPAGHEAEGLFAYAAHRWVTEPKPVHKFLVDKLLIEGETHLMVAEGGSGKTYLVADLAMKIAAFQPGDELYWCGQKILRGGAVVLILCEDSQTEMHIRLLDLDKDGLIQRAGDKLIVLPMCSCGGAFTLAIDDKAEGQGTKRWNEMMEQLHIVAQRYEIALVAIDTMNSVTHGDENSAVVIAQMMKQAQRVCNELGAALLFNHHVRKAQEPIRSLEDLKNSIRGSTAIPSFFRINMGMFKATDYERRMKGMGLRPEKDALWRFGIAKANINGLFRGEKTLLRNEIGLLTDVTDADKFNAVNFSEREAWLVFAVCLAAQNGHPYNSTGKSSPSGLYRRRAELPEILRSVGATEFANMVTGALDKDLLCLSAIKGTKSKSWLDVPGGPLASDETGAEIASGAYTPPDWTKYEWSEAEHMIVEKSVPHLGRF